MRARIHIDRLVLDGLPAATTPAALEQAIRSALADRLGANAPLQPASAKTLRLDGRTGSLAQAAGDVAGAVAGLAGRRK